LPIALEDCVYRACFYTAAAHDAIVGNNVIKPILYTGNNGWGAARFTVHKLDPPVLISKNKI